MGGASEGGSSSGDFSRGAGSCVARGANTSVAATVASSAVTVKRSSSAATARAALTARCDTRGEPAPSDNPVAQSAPTISGEISTRGSKRLAATISSLP